MPANVITQQEKDRQAPKVRDLPIGTGATGKRTESDSLGEVEVPADHYWGAQTQRSLIHFSIGNDHMPKEVLPRLRLCQESRGPRERSGRAPATLES